MRPIVFATDGSPTAQKALMQALELARALPAPLVAIAVASPPAPVYGYYTYASLMNEMRQAEDAHVRDVLAATRDAADAAGVECEVVSGTGLVADTICDVARERDARLIVIGSHGWGPIGRLVHGSVSQGVLHGAACPVLVVRGEVPEDAGQVAA